MLDRIIEWEEEGEIRLEKNRESMIPSEKSTNGF